MPAPHPVFDATHSLPTNEWTAKQLLDEYTRLTAEVCAILIIHKNTIEIMQANGKPTDAFAPLLEDAQIKLKSYAAIRRALEDLINSS